MAAAYLGVTPAVLGRWRKHGIGPAYVRYPFEEADGTLAGHGKPFGKVYYPVEGLDEWIARCMIQAGRLPKPFSGRMPGSKNRLKQQSSTARG